MSIDNYPQITDLDKESLKKKIIELEATVKHYEDILEDNDLLDSPKKISTEEYICLSEIEKLKIVSDKGALMLEDVKVLDLLVKNLLAIRGKPIQEPKTKKKSGPTPVADLLKIVERSKIQK